MLTAVGEVDKKLDPSKECFAAATEKLGGLATAAPSVWTVPKWFMPAVPVPSVLCLLLLVTGSFSSLKNPAVSCVGILRVRVRVRIRVRVRVRARVRVSY